MDYPLPIQGFKLFSAEAASEQITQLLGFGFDLFTNTILFAQSTANGTSTNFIDCTDGEQKDRFRALFALNRFEEAGELLTKDLRLERAKLEPLDQSIAVLVERVGNNQELLNTIQASKILFEEQKQKAIQELSKKLTSLEQQIAEQKNNPKLLDLAAIEAQIDSHQIRLTATRTSASELQKGLARLEQQIETLTEELKAWKPLIQPMAPLKPRNLRTQAEKDSLVVEIDVLKAGKFEIDTAAVAHDSKVALLKQAISGLEKEVASAKEHTKTRTDARSRVQGKLDDLRSGKLLHCPSCKQTLPKDKQAEAEKDLLEQLEALPLLDFSEQSKCLDSKSLELELLIKQAPDISQLTDIATALQERYTDLTDISAALEESKDYEIAYAGYLGASERYSQAVVEREARRAIISATTVSLREQLKEKQAAHSEIDLKLTEDQQKLTSLQEKRTRIVVELESVLTPLTEALTQTNTDLNNTKGKIFENEKLLVSAECGLANSLKALAEARTERDAIKILVDTLENLDIAFGDEGIVSELFKEYIPAIQERANEYLTALTSNELEILFASEKLLKKKTDSGMQASRSQFQINVRKKSGADGYDLISGSDQKKAALVCNWALSDLARTHSGMECNLRVFDEIFDSLDAKGMERLIGMLHGFSDQVVLVITHKVELEDSFHKKITLEKRNGITTLKG